MHDLDGLLVRQAVDVTFNETVSISGNLTIDAVGVVTFKKALALSGSGSLTIRGASSVVFENGATLQVTGDITVNAQGVVLRGGAGSITGAGGVLAITSAAASGSVVVGANDAAAPVAGALNLSARDLSAIGSGFSRVVIGQLAQGELLVAGPVRVAADVILLAHGQITLNAGLDTVSAHSVALTSSTGNITMAAGTRIDSHGGDVLIKADNATAVSLAIIDARSSGAASGAVAVEAGNAVVSDANRDGEVNIFATALDLFGWGPDSAAAGDVLEVAAEVVQVRTVRGVVVRESSADGQAYFNVLSGGKLYQELVVIGPVTRVTQDAATLVRSDYAARLAAGLPATSRLMTSEDWASSHGGASAASSAGNLAVSSYLSALGSANAMSDFIALSQGSSGGTDLLNDQSYGIAEKLERSYILGTPGAQPLISGLDTFSQDTFEYWVDTLTV